MQLAVGSDWRCGAPHVVSARVCHLCPEGSHTFSPPPRPQGILSSSPEPALNLLQMAPKTWSSAFPVPTLQVLRAWEVGAGPFWGTSWGQEGEGDGAPPCSLSLAASVSAALEPQGNSPHLEAEKGQFLRLLCAAASQPPATLSWALEDRVLSRSHPQGSGTLELVLPRVKPGDSGRYTCRAENRLGSQSGTLDLSVQCECDWPGQFPERERDEGGWG